MEWTVAAGVDDELVGFGAHRHELIEETFLVRSGGLEFLISDEVLEGSAGESVRVLAGMRHGYQNVSGAPVVMVVTFVPGGSRCCSSRTGRSAGGCRVRGGCDAVVRVVFE